MLGKFNRIVFSLGYQGQITGDTNDNAVDSKHVVLPCKARLEKAFISCTACAATTAKISVYQSSTKVVDQFTLASTSLTGEMTLTAAMKDTVYDALSEFSLKEQSAASTVDNISVHLIFRAYEV